MKTFTNFSSFMEGCCQGIASYFGTRLPRFDSLSLVSRQSVLPILLLCLTFFVSVENIWGAAVNSEAPANGKSFIIALYYGGNYYALPQFTSATRPAGKQCTLDANGKVTAIASGTVESCLWTLVSASTNWKITYQSGGNTYYLWKPGSTGNSYTIEARTTDSDDIWSFTAGTANSKTAYSVMTTKSTATKHTVLKARTDGTSFNVSGTTATYAITLLKPAPVITCATSSLTGFTYAAGSGPSAAQSFSVSGSYLTADISVNAPSNFEVSTSSGSGYSSSVTLTQSSGSVSATTVYIRLKSGLSTGSYTGTSITMTSTGAANKTISLSGSVTAACSADPSVGNASLNGSFSMTSTTSAVSVASGTCSTGNAACDWTDYGFVWSDGANTTAPTVGGTNCNKVKVGDSGSGTSWTGSVTPSGSTTPTSWTTGHTYYVRTYGKNSKASASYYYSETALTFTPRSVTFNLNGHGSSTPSVQYVNNGGLATDPSYSESVTGYTFGGWYDNSDWTQGTQWNFGSSTVSGGNVTLYAKWTAKTTTVSFNQNSGTGGQTGTLTATYGSAMPGAPVTCPTRTGYNFGGYYDGSGGTGTQYYTNAGASARSWDKDAATATLYAKWTAKSFTVTWMVNGVAYTPSGSGGTDGSTSVDFGSHVATLPTAPTPPCGDKFVGWSTTNIGAVGQATDAGLNLFTTAGDAPVINAEGAVTYYAVFADYDE